MDDILSAEVGKHDYDWLLIPPETSPFPFSEARDSQTLKAAPKNKSNARSVTGKASRFSVSQSEKNTFAKPTRSSSTATSALSTALSSSTCLSNSSRTAILNTSTASVTSKPSFSSNAISRHSAPAKTRPTLPSNPDKPRQPQNPRPCTPTARASSRPSTPARRATTEASPPALARSASVGHAPPANRRNNGSANRPSSPAPRERPQVQAPALQRRGAASSVDRPSSNAAAVAPAMNSIRKQSSSPIVAGRRLQENSPSARSNSKSNEGKAVVNKRPMSAEPASRRPVNSSSPTENTGSAVRKPIKHTVVVTSNPQQFPYHKKHEIVNRNLPNSFKEIKQSAGGINPAISIFPQSIRSAAQKIRSYRLPETEISAPAPGKVTPRRVDNNGVAVAL